MGARSRKSGAQPEGGGLDLPPPPAPHLGLGTVRRANSAKKGNLTIKWTINRGHLSNENGSYALKTFQGASLPV